MNPNSCSLCSDLAASRKQIVSNKGNIDAPVLIVGQNPGVEEDEHGLPFIGPAGKLLDNIITNINLQPMHDFYYTNVVRCHTPYNALPSKMHLSNCSDNLKVLLNKFDRIVTIGKFALHGVVLALLPTAVPAIELQPMYKLLTTEKPYLINNKMIFITYHTSYLLRHRIVYNNINQPLYNKVANTLRLSHEYQQIGDNYASI